MRVNESMKTNPIKKVKSVLVVIAYTVSPVTINAVIEAAARTISKS